jgi:hypothetical protein
MVSIWYTMKKVQKKRKKGGKGRGNIFFTFLSFFIYTFLHMCSYMEFGGIKKEGNIYLGEMKGIDKLKWDTCGKGRGEFVLACPFNDPLTPRNAYPQ